MNSATGSAHTSGEQPTHWRPALHTKATFLLAALTLALGGCRMSAPDLLEALAGSSKDFSQYFADAKALEERGKRTAAIIQLKNAIQQAPNDPALRLNLGNVFNENLDGVSAEKELNKARELGPDDKGQVTAALARAIWLQGDDARLIASINPSNDFSPAAQEEIYAYRGRAFTTLGKLDEAKESLARARENAGRGKIPYAQVLEASLRFFQQDPDGALAIVDQVLKTHPRFYDALVLKAGILRIRGDQPAAVAAYQDLLQVYPHSIVGLVAQSNLLIGMGRFDEAERVVQAMDVHYKNNFITHFQRGLLRFRREQFKPALESFQLSLRANPKFMQTLLFEGMTQLALNSTRSAERSLSQYVAARPEDRLGRRMLASALVQLNESTRALEVLGPILDRGEVAPDIWEIAADAYTRAGNLPLAAEWLNKAAAANPARASVRERQAKLFMKGGETDRAIAEYGNALVLRGKPAEADVVRAVQHIARREYDKAIAALDAAEKSAPGTPLVANLRGDVLLNMGQQDAAIKVFEDVLAKHPTFTPAAVNLAKLDLKAKAPDQARRRFASVLNADKNQLQALLALAELETQLGRAAEALAVLERAADAHPNAFDPRARLVANLMRQGKTEQARARAEEALSRNPSSMAAYELLGSVQMSEGDTRGAMATYRRFVDVHPKAARAHFAKGRAEFSAGMAKEAEASLREAIALDKAFVPAQTALVELLMRQKRAEPALEIARAVQTDSPKSPLGWTFEGEILSSQKKYKEAVAAYERALALAPSDDGLAVRIYHARANAGDQKGALQGLRDWVEKFPRSLGARTLLATIMLDAGDFAGAKTHYELAAHSAPNDPVAKNNLAWAYFKARDPRALKVAEEALKLRPNDPAINDTLGWILLQQGNVARGTELLGIAAKGLPNEPSVRYHYASALAKSGVRERARAELATALALGKPFADREQAVALLQELKR